MHRVYFCFEIKRLYKEKLAVNKIKFLKSVQYFFKFNCNEKHANDNLDYDFMFKSEYYDKDNVF